MNLRRSALSVGFIFPWVRVVLLAASLGPLPLAEAGSAAPSNQIQVSLFGQPCLLQGPVEVSVLKTIHSLSPEQLYPERKPDPSSEPTRRALSKLRDTRPPAALDRYRERLTQRLEAQLSFLDGLEAFRKTRGHAALRNAAKTFLRGRPLKEFNEGLKKAEGIRDLRSERGREALESLFDRFTDGLGPDPEEEFHRAIGRMGVQYLCTFEENGQ